MGRCKETAGFLFARPCKGKATAACGSCARPICAQHSRRGLCITCSRKQPAAGGSDPYRLSHAYYDDYDELESCDRFTVEDGRAFEEGSAAWEERWDEPRWEDDFDGS